MENAEKQTNSKKYTYEMNQDMKKLMLVIAQNELINGT